MPSAGRRSENVSANPHTPLLPERSPRSELELNPPEYTRFNEAPPPYRQSSWAHTVRYGAVDHDVPIEETRQFDELKSQQELQLLLGVLFLIALTSIFMEALPMLGQPTASLRVMRVYGWFTLAFFLNILVVSVSLLCRRWLIQNNPGLLPIRSRRSSGTLVRKLQSVTKSVVNCMIASGPVLIYLSITCLVVGVVDFFWQLYPTLVVTGCGIFASGPVISRLSHRTLKGPTSSTLSGFSPLGRHRTGDTALE
ncbi:hypothetical protein C8R46DRAFT_68610 [Mycena filopes]|nr:hypothetical protein C8R46DRAFT_68610 [Mycena filopes]